MKQFTEHDIKDKERLERMIQVEAYEIHRSQTSRKYRTYNDIEKVVRQGKIAELYMIENYNFREADKKYHDLISPNGNYIEVKAYSVYDSNAPYVQKDLQRYRKENWNISKWYILFSVWDGVYTYLETINIEKI